LGETVLAKAQIVLGVWAGEGAGWEVGVIFGVLGLRSLDVLGQGILKVMIVLVLFGEG